MYLIKRKGSSSNEGAIRQFDSYSDAIDEVIHLNNVYYMEMPNLVGSLYIENTETGKVVYE